MGCSPGKAARTSLLTKYSVSQFIYENKQGGHSYKGETLPNIVYCNFSVSEVCLLLSYFCDLHVPTSDENATMGSCGRRRAYLVAQCKESICNAGDVGSIPGSGRSPAEGNGNPLPYSCLGNRMDRGATWATVCGVKSRTLLNTHTHTEHTHAHTHN